MSGVVIDNLASPWTSSSPGLWAVSVSEAASRDGETSPGMTIVARSAPAGTSAPSARRELASPRSLRAYEELRFWLRSTRAADGSAAAPFYLALEITGGPPGTAPWRRFLPVARGGAWELMRLWLGDMPPEQRRAVDGLTLRGLDPTVSFTASLSHLIAAKPEPVQDVDRALVTRLHKRFRVRIEGATRRIPAVLDPPAGEPAPHILITPWAIRPGAAAGGSGEIIDNFTPQGALVRPPRRSVELEYRIEVFAGERSQRARVIDGILAELGRRPFLLVSGEIVQLTAFAPAPAEAAQLVPPGRTPLFYRLTVEVDAGVGRFQPMASPYLVVGDTRNRTETESFAIRA